MNSHYTASESIAYRRRQHNARLHTELVADLYEAVNNGAIELNLAMLIAETLGPGDWRADAACRGEDPDLFFPTVGNKHDAAKAICRRCPVRQQCFDYADTAPEVDGVWGGWSASSRRNASRNDARMRTRFSIPAKACIDCGVPIDGAHRATCEPCSDQVNLARERRYRQRCAEAAS